MPDLVCEAIELHLSNCSCPLEHGIVETQLQYMPLLMS